MEPGPKVKGGSLLKEEVSAFSLEKEREKRKQARDSLAESKVTGNIRPARQHKVRLSEEPG